MNNTLKEFKRPPPPGLFSDQGLVFKHFRFLLKTFNAFYFQHFFYPQFVKIFKIQVFHF